MATSSFRELFGRARLRAVVVTSGVLLIAGSLAGTAASASAAPAASVGDGTSDAVAPLSADAQPEAAAHEVADRPVERLPRVVGVAVEASEHGRALPARSGREVGAEWIGLVPVREPALEPASLVERSGAPHHPRGLVA